MENTCYRIKPLIWEVDHLSNQRLVRTDIFLQVYGPVDNPIRVEVLEYKDGGEVEYIDEAKTVEKAKKLAEDFFLARILYHLEEVK
jgi:hypothetical protein